MKLKQLLIAVPLLALMCACSHKNVLRENLEDYPYDKYLSKVASANTKTEAKAAALAEIKGIFDILPSDPQSQVRRDNILSLAKIAKTWKIKQDGNKRYYAMAILERKPAMEALQPYYTGYDAKIKSLTNNLNEEQDKFVRLKNALTMEKLLKERNPLDDEYRILSYDATLIQCTRGIQQSFL